MSYAAEERETILRCDDETKLWSIETYMSTTVTKLRKAGIEPFSVREDGQYLYKDVPFNQVSFRSKSAERAPMSDEQKIVVAQRFADARNNRNKTNDESESEE